MDPERAAVPAPVDDPVAAALRLRASDADRDKIAGVLRDAYAEGRLTPAEHEERLAEVYRAQTYGDLVPVLRDLPVPAGTLPVPATGPAVSVTPTTKSPSIPVEPSLAASADGPAVAIFSGFERRGEWVVAPELSATCIFGGGELDFTNARLTAPETVLTVVCLFGGLEITVPDDLAVRGEVIGIFGGSDIPSTSVPPGAPTLVIKGAAIFGGVSVKRPGVRRRRITG